ncbi:thioesterase family protein [Celeribacter litoreus]|uniref:thioesterase family protein n=1 Tax=Celeribacter litoreus TaxID=2876714 RepID=UPI001CCE0F12|nr:thioesterase family protein [Celeribacter litoreus]MCA0043369.1 thioesterase family protein [Celeribacter litoreus]
MFDRLKRTESAVVSYSGAVKRWECDRNGHMNVQFYVRAFQMASEVLATLVLGENPGTQSSDLRHYRFHGELFSGEAMHIQSSRIADGEFAGWVLHRMFKGARLSATAIERPAYPVEGLPACRPEALEKALPRGLSPTAERAGGLSDTLSASPVGVLRPSELDHHGAVQWNALTALCSNASHGFLEQIGLTADWVNTSNCNRMAVEMSIARHGLGAAGDTVAIRAGIADVASRSFTMRMEVVHGVTAAPLATVEQLCLVVDLESRKPVMVPEFVRTAAARYGMGS